jgi:hypothetical protein
VGVHVCMCVCACVVQARLCVARLVVFSQRRNLPWPSRVVLGVVLTTSPHHHSCGVAVPRFDAHCCGAMPTCSISLPQCLLQCLLQCRACCHARCNETAAMPPGMHAHYAATQRNAYYLRWSSRIPLSSVRCAYQGLEHSETLHKFTRKAGEGWAATHGALCLSFYAEEVGGGSTSRTYDFVCTSRQTCTYWMNFLNPDPRPPSVANLDDSEI